MEERKETREGTVIHNSLADQIADCEYHITVAQMGYTRSCTKRKWLKRLEELKKQITKAKEL